MIKSDISSSISSNAQTARGNLVTDEWSCALADSSTQGVSNLDSATQAYCQGQEKVYRDGGAGYAFWSYTMDGCKAGDGNGWCFKGSVANSLQKTFFSYEAQTEPLDGIAVDGTTNSTTSSSSSSSNDDANSNDGANSSSSTASSTSTAVEGSSSSGQSCKASKKKRDASSSASNNARRRHNARNPAPHSHRSSSSSKRASNSSKGYQDGLAAAKKFAKLGGSKLGFTLQFIKDTTDKPTDSYIQDFTNGVKDGEGQVDKALRKRRK